MSSYTVKSGDTLSGIAQSQLGDATRYLELATLNGIASPYTIYPGQVLQLPGTVAAPATTTVATVPATTPASSTAATGALTSMTGSVSTRSGLSAWFAVNKGLVILITLGLAITGISVYANSRQRRRRHRPSKHQSQRRSKTS